LESRRVVVVLALTSTLSLVTCRDPGSRVDDAKADPASAATSAASGPLPNAGSQGSRGATPIEGLSPDADPALLRRALLREMDARIDEASARSHLEARWIMDEVIPIPYLGIDSEPADGGMRLKAVYAMTGAEAAGLKKGDLILAIDATKTDSKKALARAIRLKRVGDTLAVKIRRDGREQTLPCTLRPRPEEDEDEEEQFPDLEPLPGPSTHSLAFDFEKDELGALPAAFTTALGGHGRPGRWIIAESSSHRVLRQDDDDPTGIRFPIVLARDFDGKDVKASVRFRYAGGRVDKAGGIVLRYADPGNYLVARANAAEGDVRIFRVANGLRRTLPDGIGQGATDDDAWHTLEFTAQGPKLTAVLDGKVTVVAYDTYFLRGGVGLWTKSDSLTEFDDLKIEALK
jgi:hypothetical protein